MRFKFVVLIIVAAGMMFTFLSFENNFAKLQQLHHATRQILQTGPQSDPMLSRHTEPNLTPIEISKTKNLPNIPDYFLGNAATSKLPQGHNASCVPKHPDLLDLEFNNDLWQTQLTSNGTFQLFSAHHDGRPSTGAVVRIVTMYDRIKPIVKMHCQLWYGGDAKMTIVEPEPLYYLWNDKWGGQKQGIYQPYLISCPLPSGKEVPLAVSLVEEPCDKPSNSLRVHHKDVKKEKNFAVCVKGLNFPYEDKTVRFAEWIELLRLLGADKINFYDFSMHPNTKRLLDYYEDEGLVEVSKLTLVGPYSNDPFVQSMFLHKKLTERRLQEVIPYNDCLYKHKDEFRYVVLLDTDEVIVPRNANWIDLLAVLEKDLKGQTGGYAAQNVYFWDAFEHQHDWFEGIPRHMHMLQHVWRSRNYTKPGHYVKSFHDTDQVIALHNHFPKICIRGPCTARPIDKELAHLQHYRQDCVSELKNSCQGMKEDSVMDTTIWAYRDELIERVARVLGDLGFLKESSPVVVDEKGEDVVIG